MSRAIYNYKKTSWIYSGYSSFKDYPLFYIKFHGVSKNQILRGQNDYFLINFSLSVVFPSVISAIYAPDIIPAILIALAYGVVNTFCPAAL